jgi:hypothetical protein
LFARYRDDRIATETFQEFCLRHTNEELTGYLSPEATTSVERGDAAASQCLGVAGD